MQAGDRAPGRAGRREAAVDRLAATNVAGLLYGGIVSAATIAVVAGHAQRGVAVVAAVAAVLFTYWLAHVYVRALSDRLTTPASALAHHLRRAFRHEATVLLGGLPALVLFTVEVLLGLQVGVAGSIALWFSVVLLGTVGYLAAHGAGLRGGALALETCVAALFGVAAVALKGLLH